MVKSALRVLLVDDDEDEYVIVGDLLRETRTETFDLTWVAAYEQGLEAILSSSYDVCLVDYRLGQRTGLDLLAEVKAKSSHAQIILLTGEGDRALDVTATKAGAADYLVKGELTAALLERSLRYAVERGRILKELRDATLLAQSMNLAKSAFLANISHEIRTPMNSILGTTDLLLETELNDAQARLVFICQRNSSLMLSLINDLLDLSKIEADAIELSRVPFSISEFAEDVEQIFFAQAKEKGIEFQATVAADVPKGVVGDPNRLKQVVINLLANALKFTAEGRVSLAITLDGKETDGWRLRFAVTDTGIGIAREHLDLIFGAFQQAHWSIAHRFGGTGLGLAISKRLVELMDGAITVESTPGLGSTFSFAVHMAQPDDAEIVHLKKTRVRMSNPASASPIGSANSTGTGAILVVEDNEDNTFLVNAYLSPEGYQLDFARNGQEAVEKVKRGRYALVLMDVRMPVKGGYAATSEIRSWEMAMGVTPVPILALTAHSLEGEEEKARQAGCSGYLPKPLVRQDLVREVAARVRSGTLVRGGDIAKTSKKIQARVPAYLARRSADVERMRGFLRDGRMEQICALGHQMTGSATGFGFPELSRLGAEIEKSATAQNRENLQELLRSLDGLVRQFQINQGNAETEEGVSVSI
jgi:signal transduction histidine kinase/HPt (histidine-containing phosphotransfer) domain-containing protein